MMHLCHAEEVIASLCNFCFPLSVFFNQFNPMFYLGVSPPPPPPGKRASGPRNIRPPFEMLCSAAGQTMN